MQNNEKELIVFLDCGDTLVDESTQIFEGPIVMSADLFPGAREMALGMYEAGWRIILVADGRVDSFQNLFAQHGLDHIFHKKVISEELGVEKPHEEMFLTAMDRAGLTAEDTPRIVMIGNNLERDIVGANRMGITSILLSYTPRYTMQPKNDEEVPDFVVSCPQEVLPLLEQLELQVKNRKILQASA